RGRDGGAPRSPRRRPPARAHSARATREALGGRRVCAVPRLAGRELRDRPGAGRRRRICGMTTAFLFAGQGVDAPWVARCLLDGAAAEALRAAANDASGAETAKLLLRGGRKLTHPAILQPALVATCLCVAAELAAAGVVPAVVCGHSLGELAAWAAGGYVSAV